MRTIVILAATLAAHAARADGHEALPERVALAERTSLADGVPVAPPPSSSSSLYLEDSLWIGASTVDYRSSGSGWTDHVPSTELAARIAFGRRSVSNASADRWGFDVGALLDMHFVRDRGGLGESRLGGLGFGIEGRVGKQLAPAWRGSLRASLGLGKAGDYGGSTFAVGTLGVRFDYHEAVLGLDLVQNSGVLTYEQRLDLGPPVVRRPTGILVGFGVTGRPARYATATAFLGGVAAAIAFVVLVPDERT